MAVSTPHFRVPFAASGTSFAVVEQDSAAEIDQCVLAALRTPVGSRIEEPEYGTPDETFEQLGPALSAESYLNAIADWEPRAREVGEARLEELTKQVQIRPAERTNL